MNGIAERITRSLNGHWYGSYGLAMCPAHENTQTPALSLSEGNSGQLLAHCHSGCHYQAVFHAMRNLGLLVNTGCDFPDRTTESPNTGSAKQDEAFKREAHAKSCWKASCPISGSPAEHYLRNRGITCDLPLSLRFHAHCWHGPSARCNPAMIALVEGGSGTAVHRTFLRLDGKAKATLNPAKMMLGGVSGGAVRLSKAPGPLIVAEGIETALSLASGIYSSVGSVWAALSASGMAGLRIPEVPHEIVIATDGDNTGRQAGNSLAERAYSLGWRVSLLPAPDGYDWNDVLLAREDNK